MLAFFRQLLIVLFILLQSVAPLVHAHTDRDDLQSGLHLHLFEFVNFSHDQVTVSATHYAQDFSGSIVSVSSAIKQQLTFQGVNTVAWPLIESQNIPVERYYSLVNFSPHVAGLIAQPFLCNNTSRAPPFF